MHNEAVAHETAARFYRGRGFAFIADGYLREAVDRYLRWGADGKVGQLESQHPQLVEPRPLGATATLALRPEQLDLLAVIKASQTISGVMVQKDLLGTLLQVVLEEGGARRARIILARGANFEIAAEAAVDEVPPPRTSPPAEPPVCVPASILQYVQRTHERVLLDDATADPGRFASDEYLARTRPRSVLCLPIRRQAEIVALLYLENDLLPGAFTPERLLALELLAAQAAISLENALLLERERAGRVGAEAAGRRALLLGEATALMSSTLDYEHVLHALTRLCVRSFADWAVIDVVEGGHVVRLAGAHRDPEKEPLLRELSTRFPASVGSPAPAAAVMESGSALLLDDVTDDVRRAHATDEDHAELIRQLGTRSVIVVPMIARGVQLGALTLASASPGRFEHADLELAAEMGRRAALAIDNARLLRETQKAVRLRDEFLSVASHELRTPMTSLKLTVQSLLDSDARNKPIAPESRDRSLNRVLRGAERLQRLTDELLDVTRIERGPLELQPTEVELGALVRRIVEELKLELTGAHCSVSIDAPAPVPGAWDASKLGQVVTNLLSNAMKFGAGRPIEVRVRDAGDAAELRVRDHGIGIDPARQPFVFNRFERAVSSAHYAGLGLGLYIARRIVQAHGGTIRVESEPGHGTTFTVELPRVVPATAEEDASLA